MNYNEAMEKLKKYGQEHVLKYYAELPDEQRNTLIEQIDRTDFTVIGQAAETGKRGTIAPIKAMTIPEIDMGRERLGLLAQSAVYFVISLCVWLLVGNFCWCITKYPQAFVSVIVSYTASYIVCWVIQYRICKKNIADINKKIMELEADNHGERDSN